MSGWATIRLMKSLIFALLTAITLAVPAWSQEVIRTTREQIRKAEVHHILLFNRSRAERLHKELLAEPTENRFAAFKNLATRYSRDPASAGAGGDLGLVWEGQMEQVFDDALFAATPGEVSAPFRTEFGWHLLWVKAFQHEPVAPLCDKWLKESIAKAKPEGKAVLQMSVRALDRPDLFVEVQTFMGGDWSAPLQDKDGNLVYFSSAPSTASAGIKLMQRHIDYVDPWVKVHPQVAACTRSRRETWAVNCEVKTMALSALTDYEGRAGAGRTVNHTQFSRTRAHTDVEFSPVKPGTLGEQLLAQGCGAVK